MLLGGGGSLLLGLSSVSMCGFRLKESFVVTGSQDCTVKVWPLPEAPLSRSAAKAGSPVLLQAQATQRCHDKVSRVKCAWGAGSRRGMWSDTGGGSWRG